jgi:hypothetical protein
MTEKLGWQIQEEAYAAFDAWLAAQPDEVHEMGLLEQIDLYATSTNPTPTTVQAAPAARERQE